MAFIIVEQGTAVNLAPMIEFLRDTNLYVELGIIVWCTSAYPTGDPGVKRQVKRLSLLLRTSARPV
jgi:hypothetical protein